MFHAKKADVFFLVGPFYYTASAPHNEQPEWKGSLWVVKVSDEEQLYLAFANRESAEELLRCSGVEDSWVVSHAELSADLYHDFNRHNLLLLNTPGEARSFWQNRQTFPYSEYRVTGFKES